MIRDSIEFFQKEKRYTVLFVLVTAVYTALMIWGRPPESVSAPVVTEALEQFQAAESRMMQDVEQAGSVEDFLRKNPGAANLFQLLIFIVAGLFSSGLIVLFTLLFNARWRQNLQVKAFREEVTDWKLSMMFKAVLLFLAASLALNLALGLLQRFVIPGISENLIVLLQTTLVDVICLYLLVYLVCKAGGSWKELGFRIPPQGFWREVLTGFVGYLGVFPVFMGVLVFLVYIAHLFAYEPPPHPLVNILLEEEKGSTGLIVYSVLLATIIAPFLEEVFFRGFCYPILKKKWGAGAAMLLTSLFFATIHANTFAFWPIFVLGMALAYLYEKRRSLTAPVVLHLVHNSIFILYFFLAKNLVLNS